MTDSDRFQSLLAARYPCVAVTTAEEHDGVELAIHAAVEAGLPVWLWSQSKGVRDGLLRDAPPVPDTEHPAAALYHLESAEAGRRSLFVALDLCPHLSRDERVLRQWRDLVARCARDGSTLLMIDCHADRPDVVRQTAAVFELSLPDEAELEQILKSTLRDRNDERPVQVVLGRRDVETILRNLKGLTRRQAAQLIVDAVCDDNRLDVQDVNHILAGKRRLLQSSGLLEYVESPVDLAEIGGLERLKLWLDRRKGAMTKEAAAFGIDPPRGVLMLGVQGAGKSLAAKAVATAWRVPLMRMDVGALYDRYVGESERRLRDTLRQAESMAPIVLWIDEIEKAFASAASRSTDGGLSQRMFGTLLTWMQERGTRTPPFSRDPKDELQASPQGSAPAPGVFVIATANDIEALPPELLRKGRFDEIFFVDLPTLDARAQILTIHLKRRNRDPKQFDLATLAQASDGFSGAEIEQAIVSALHEAFATKTELTTQIILDVLAKSPPISVTMRERIDGLRAWARGRCVPAD
ncbi:MAG TPA: AAA family ATPase [Tepidisphaeraceae bacterium]|nr:AAA family ATPase [Tepidisphaeraceae bacterium]